MAVKFPIYALTLHRENVGSMGFSNEHDVASRHSLTYLKREVIGVYTRIKRGEIFFNFPNLKLDIGYQQIYLSYNSYFLSTKVLFFCFLLAVVVSVS